MKRKHYRVYVVADDPFCMGLIQFDAHVAVLSRDKFTLIVDGMAIKSSDGFCNLEEGWIN